MTLFVHIFFWFLIASSWGLAILEVYLERRGIVDPVEVYYITSASITSLVFYCFSQSLFNVTTLINFSLLFVPFDILMIYFIVRHYLRDWKENRVETVEYNRHKVYEELN